VLHEVKGLISYNQQFLKKKKKSYNQQLMTKLHVLCMTYNQRPMAATSIHEATS